MSGECVVELRLSVYVLVAERTLTAAQCPVSGLMYASLSTQHQHCTYRFLTTTSSTDATAAAVDDRRVTQCFNASAVAAKCASQGITNTPHLHRQAYILPFE